MMDLHLCMSIEALGTADEGIYVMALHSDYAGTWGYILVYLILSLATVGFSQSCFCL